MSDTRPRRRLALPLLAGLVAAAAAFAVTASVDDSEPSRPPAAPAASAGPPGAAVFREIGCGSCHTLGAAGSTGELGPSLDERLPAHTRDSLRGAIVRPPAGSMMPDDYGGRMTPAELDALVDFLLDSRRRG